MGSTNVGDTNEKDNECIIDKEESTPKSTDVSKLIDNIEDDSPGLILSSSTESLKVIWTHQSTIHELRIGTLFLNV